jgi:hypothetical protein
MNGEDDTNSHRGTAGNAPVEPSHQQTLTSPRGAAIAGVIFSVLMIVGLGLGRLAVPTDLTHPGTWLSEPDRRDAVRLALDLVPFAGIAFLWFMGVLRARLGELEDKFFATVFLGSGVLFVACLFGVAALLNALIGAVTARNIRSPDSETYYFGRRAIGYRRTPELVRDENGGGLHGLDLHHRVTQRHSPTLAGLYRLRVCPSCSWS